jgi:hypothetical protein
MSKMRGLCIILEGRYARSCKELGYPYEVSNILFLDDILYYADRNNLGVLYLSSIFGVAYSDDIIPRSAKHVSSIHGVDFMKWSYIVSEEIVRECIHHQTLNVVLICKSKYNLELVEEILRGRGINIETPISGKSTRDIPYILRNSSKDRK